MSVRFKLTLSYAGFLMVAGVGLIAVVLVFLLRYVPEHAVRVPSAFAGNNMIGSREDVFIPGRRDLWSAFAPKAAMMLALLLVFGLVGGWILAGRMLAPLHRINEVTRSTGSGSLSHRIQLPGRQDEFRELADSFDDMLARLEAYVAGQQRFAANASHELRTPLAITQTLLEVARNDPDSDVDALHERLRVVNTRAIELTEALLVLSRADQRSFAREHVDLSLIAEEATETLLPLAEENGVDIEASGEFTPTIGSRALLLQMTTNLVHNAIVHNLCEHGVVRISTALRAGMAVLTVENTGDILSPQLVPTLTEPFRRGTERVHSDQAGVGLGLAIVKSVAQAHDGTITLVPRATGGLCVCVQLPAVAPAGDDRAYAMGKSKYVCG